MRSAFDVRDNQPLDRKAWVSAALEVLAADGIDQVRVELLARKLSITKGSFYHHFRDRDDLHAAMLESWRQRMVTEIIADLERIPDPRLRFHRLLRVPAEDSRADLNIELALRLWARRDGRVRAALEEVDALRLDYIAEVIRQCGVPAEKLRERAMLAYALLRTSDSRRNEEVLAKCEVLLTAP